MNRADFQALAQLRLTEAQALFDKDCFHGCYYLAGYVVECALKARIAKSTQAEDFPDKNKVNRSWDHDLGALLRLGELLPHLEADSKAAKELGDNWSVVKDWNEGSRYDRSIDDKRANDLLHAVADAPHGVLVWLQQYW